MSIKEISTDELRRMKDREGIVFQGCGGSLDEWVDGVNEMLTESGILQNGTKFTDVYSFENDNLTNLLFPFDEKVNLDIGKLAMWRLLHISSFMALGFRIMLIIILMDLLTNLLPLNPKSLTVNS